MRYSMAKAILTLDEINLLRHSEEPKNIKLYGNLYETLNNLGNTKAVTLGMIPDLDEAGVAALTYNKKSLIETVIKEWYAERVIEEDPDKKVRCGLCNTPNKYLYFIRNRLNGETLNVGSSCITKFPGMEGYVEQKKQMSQIHKNHRVAARRMEFHTRFPDVEKTISNADDYIASLPIVLPADLYCKLKDTGNRMHAIYNSYVNEGKKPMQSVMDSFELFELAKSQFLRLSKEADAFIEANQSDPLICKRREVDWLMQQHKKGIVQRIGENSGKFNVFTLGNIFSYEFVKANIELFLKRNQSKIFKIKSMSNRTLSFRAVLSTKQYPQIQYTIRFSDFMKQIGARCILDNQYVYAETELLNVAQINRTYENINIILGYTAPIIAKIDYALLIDPDSEELILYCKADKAIRIIQIDQFLDGYHKHILDNDRKILKYLQTMVLSTSSKWYSYDMQVRLSIANKIGKLYKQQILDL